MKRIISVVLALLICAMCCVAGAEVSYIAHQLDLKYPDLNRHTNTLSAQAGDGESIYDKTGTRLTSKKYKSIRNNEFGFVVSNASGINSEGYLNGEGVELVPPVYGDIYAASADWQMGIKLEKATIDAYDYKSMGSDKEFFRVSSVDVFYQGNKVGTLDRNGYADYPTAHGAYLYLKDRSGNYHFYNNKFEESGYQSEYGHSEYNTEYKNGKTIYTHCGSNQEAFVPGCTLTPEEVDQTIVCQNGQLINLQGEVIATLQYKYVYSFRNGYAVVKNAQDICGLIDMQGNEVLPCVYDEISDYNGNYASAVKDGKQGFIRLSDGTEQGFEYSASIVDVALPFAYVQDLDGTVIVISAETGKLPERYIEYRKGSYGSCTPVFVAKNADGACGVVDLYGNAVIPFDAVYDDTYDLTVSNDGTVVLGNDKRLYEITYNYDEVTATEAPEAAADGDGWICPACGKDNPATANFCPADGIARPEAPAGWFCPECGTQYDNDANFCMNDGTARP